MHTRISLAALLLVAALSSACASESTPPPPVAPSGKPVDQATAGSISGRISFEGTAPSPERIRMTSDPACVKGSGPNPQSDAVLVSKDGALQNVFVYLKEGLAPGYTFDQPSSPVVLDQSGCHYSPRVLGVRVGQPIKISNSDPTFHNVHALPKTNREFNHGLPLEGTDMLHTFTAPEVMVHFKCDVHGWMAAYVGVVAHPFFAVSGADGAFELKGVPPGTYTLEAWHERFGTRTAQVTIGDRQAQTVALSFAAK